jgi:hypothetical protein
VNDKTLQATLDVPGMKIIPPTLLVSDQNTTATDYPVEDNTMFSEPLLQLDEDANTEHQPFLMGRTSNSVQEILDEAFQRLHEEFGNLSAQTGMPPQQIIDRFVKVYSRSNANNFWNSYQPCSHRTRSVNSRGSPAAVE